MLTVLLPSSAEDTKIGGASAGSLIAACYHSGISPKAATSACLTLADQLRKSGTRGKLKVSCALFLRTFPVVLPLILRLATLCHPSQIVAMCICKMEAVYANSMKAISILSRCTFTVC